MEDFQEGAAMAAILDFQSECFFAFFDLQVAQNFLSSFKSISLAVQEKKLKTDLQNEFPNRTILATFDLQVIPII